MVAVVRMLVVLHAQNSRYWHKAASSDEAELASPQAATQKRENEKQPEIEFFSFRVPEQPHGFAIEEIAREYNTIRERISVHFGSAIPTFDVRIDYDLYVSRMEEAEERERKQAISTPLRIGDA